MSIKYTAAGLILRGRLNETPFTGRHGKACGRQSPLPLGGEGGWVCLPPTTTLVQRKFLRCRSTPGNTESLVGSDPPPPHHLEGFGDSHTALAFHQNPPKTSNPPRGPAKKRCLLNIHLNYHFFIPPFCN